MKGKDFFNLIDTVKSEKVRQEFIMYRNAFETILSLKECEQLDVFRWFFVYSLYGIEPKFDEKLIQNRQNKSSIEFIFALLKKQRIGWEKAHNQIDSTSDPPGGGIGGTPTPTPSRTHTKKSISNDIQVSNDTSPNGQVVYQQQVSNETSDCVTRDARTIADRDSFGIFKNVFLHRKELEALQMNYGIDPTNTAIENLSCKLADGSVQSTYHYATLRNWLSFRKADTSSSKTKSKTETADSNVEAAKAMLGIN